jgi:probable F420-dependent oxidoreductase
VRPPEWACPDEIGGGTVRLVASPLRSREELVVKFGYSLFGVGPRHYATVARDVEQAGFESIWMPEHLIMPVSVPPTYPYTEHGVGEAPIDSDTPLYDPWVALSFMAAATTTLRVATNVFVLPLRHPIAVARSVVTLDRVSGGRVTVGIGVGWLEDEFDVMTLSFRDRGRRTDEAIEVIRRLWTEPGDIEHHGEFFDFPAVRFQPKPVQKPVIPIEVGGTSKPALRRAGRLGDGWIEMATPDLDTLRSMLAVINGERKEAGRDHLPFEVSWSIAAPTLDDVQRAAAAGVTRIITGPRTQRITPDVVHDYVSRIHDEVITRL